MSYALRVIVNGTCNFCCFFCYQEGIPYASARSLSCSQFAGLVKEMSALRPLAKVRITGGEPLLYPDLLPLLQAIRAELPQVDLGVTTNGSLPERLLGLAEALEGDPLRVTISLPSLQPKKFAAITGSATGYTGVRASIDGLVARGLATRTSLNYLYLPGINDGELPDVVAFARARNLRLKVICPVWNVHNWEQMHSFAVGHWQEEAIVARVAAGGYRPLAGDAFECHDGHRVEVVNCMDQQPIPYFRKFRTLRVYYDGRVGVNGDYDGFIRPLDMDEPRRTLATILQDIERCSGVAPPGAGVQQPGLEDREPTRNPILIPG